MTPYYGGYNSEKRIKKQCEWDSNRKAQAWQRIVRKKITMQADFLQMRGKAEKAALLREYAAQAESNDASNREGHAAKAYFNNAFADGFTRGCESAINAYLNYGCAVLLSAFNREISALGCITQLGVWHCNEFNNFNLSCDLMEPFRVVVDCQAFKVRAQTDGENFKRRMAGILCA